MKKMKKKNLLFKISHLGADGDTTDLTARGDFAMCSNSFSLDGAGGDTHNSPA